MSRSEAAELTTSLLTNQPKYGTSVVVAPTPSVPAPTHPLNVTDLIALISSFLDPKAFFAFAYSTFKIREACDDIDVYKKLYAILIYSCKINKISEHGINQTHEFFKPSVIITTAEGKKQEITLPHDVFSPRGERMTFCEFIVACRDKESSIYSSLATAIKNAKHNPNSIFTFPNQFRQSLSLLFASMFYALSALLFCMNLFPSSRSAETQINILLGAIFFTVASAVLIIQLIIPALKYQQAQRNGEIQANRLFSVFALNRQSNAVRVSIPRSDAVSVDISSPAQRLEY